MLPGQFWMNREFQCIENQISAFCGIKCWMMLQFYEDLHTAEAVPSFDKLCFSLVPFLISLPDQNETVAPSRELFCGSVHNL